MYRDGWVRERGIVPVDCGWQATFREMVLVIQLVQVGSNIQSLSGP